jgi:hypothetical protein
VTIATNILIKLLIQRNNNKKRHPNFNEKMSSKLKDCENTKSVKCIEKKAGTPEIFNVMSITT